MPVAAPILVVAGAAVAGAAVAYTAIKAQIPKPTTAVSAEDRGVDLARKLDAEYPREVGVGVFATGGSGLYDTTTGSSNQFVWRVSGLSDYEITGFRQLWLNGELAALDGDPLLGWVNCTSHFLKKDGSPSYRVRLMPGTDDQALDPSLSAAAGSDLAGGDRFAGMAIAITRQEHDAESNLTSEPGAVVWVLEGAPLHDPRDPASDPDDESTWSRTSDARFNPALQTAQAIRGWKRGGEVVVGAPAAFAARILDTQLVAAADECDEAMAIDGGGTEPRYRAGCLVRVDKDRGLRPSLEKLFAAMDGDLVESGGIFKILPGVERVAEHHFDIEALGGRVLDYDPYGAATQRYNEAACSIADVDAAYQPLPLPAYKPSEYRSQDAKRSRVMSIGLGTVDSPFQGTRIQRQSLDRSRQLGTIRVELPLTAMGVEPGDWLTITSRVAGIENSLWVAAQWRRVTTQRGIKVIIEADAIAVTPWNWTNTDASEVYKPDYPVSPTIPTPTPVIPVITLDPRTVSGGGAVEPAIGLSWDPAFVSELDTTVEVQWRREGSTDVHSTAIDKRASYVLLREGILPGTTVEVRARVTGGNGRAGDWSDWEPTSTSVDYTVPNAGALGGRAAQEVNSALDTASALGDDVDAARDEIAAGSDDLASAFATLKASISPTASNLDDALSNRLGLIDTTTTQLNSDIKAQVRDTQRALAMSAKTLLTFDVVQEYTREISASVGNFSATFSEDIQALSSDVASLVTQVTAWTAVNVDGDISSALIAEIDARVAGDNANALNITTAQTTADNALARANDAISLNVSPASALAQRFSGLDSDVSGLTTNYSNIVNLTSIDGTAIQNLLTSLDSERDPNTPGSLRAQIDEAKQTQISDNLARVAAERRMRALVGRSMVSFEALQIAQASDTEAFYQEFERVDLAVAANTASFEAVLDMSVDPSSAFITRFTAAEAELDSANAGSVAAKTANLENIVLAAGTGHVDRISAIELDLNAGQAGSFAAKVETHESAIYDGATGILQRLGVLEGDSSDFSTEIATLQEGLIDQERALAREIRRVRAQSARAAAALETQTETQARDNEAALTLITTAQVGVDENRAAFESVLDLSADPQSALLQKLDSLTTQADTTAAGLAEVINLEVDGQTALAQKFTSLDATDTANAQAITDAANDLSGEISAAVTTAEEAVTSEGLIRAREARRLAARSARGEVFTESTRLAQQTESEAISGRVDAFRIDFDNYQAEVEQTFLAKTDFNSTLAAYTVTVNASTRTLAEHLNHIEDSADSTAQNLANNYYNKGSADLLFMTASEVDSVISTIDLSVNSTFAGLVGDVDAIEQQLPNFATSAYVNQTFTTQADVDQSIANANLSLNSTFAGLEQRVSGAESGLSDRVTTADFNQSISTLTNADTAFTQQLNTLSSQTQTIEGQIADIQTDLDPSEAGSLAELVGTINSDYITSTSLTNALSSIGLDTSASYNIEGDLYGEAGVSTGISAASSLFLNSFVDVTNPDSPVMLSQFAVQLGAQGQAQLRGIHDGSTGQWLFDTDQLIIRRPGAAPGTEFSPFVFDTNTGEFTAPAIVSRRLKANTSAGETRVDIDPDSDTFFIAEQMARPGQQIRYRNAFWSGPLFVWTDPGNIGSVSDPYAWSPPSSWTSGPLEPGKTPQTMDTRSQTFTVSGNELNNIGGPVIVDVDVTGVLRMWRDSCHEYHWLVRVTHAVGLSDPNPLVYEFALEGENPQFGRAGNLRSVPFAFNAPLFRNQPDFDAEDDYRITVKFEPVIANDGGANGFTDPQAQNGFDYIGPFFENVRVRARVIRWQP